MLTKKKKAWLIVLAVLVALALISQGYKYSFFQPSAPSYPNIPSGKIMMQPIDFIFNVSGNKSMVYVGDDAILNVKVTSLKPYGYKGILKLKYSTAAPFGISEYTDSKVVDIAQGENKFIFQVKTQHFTDKLDVTPILDVYYLPTRAERTIPTSIFGGNDASYSCPSDLGSLYLPTQSKATCEGIVNELGCQHIATSTANCGTGTNYGFKPLDPQVNFVPLGTAQETIFSVMIVPKVNETEYYNALNRANTLNASLQDKLALIAQLSGTLEEKGKALNDLQLSIDAQTQAINQLTQKADEQGVLINQLQLNVDQKAAMIVDLTKNIQDQSILIFDLQNKEKAQADILNNLQNSLTEKAAIIAQLTAENNKQGEIIANLNLNLQQKAQIISQLDITTAQQAELIKAMKLSFADQQTLIDSLGLKVSDSQALVLALQGSVAEQTALSEKYKAESAYYATQLNALQGNIDQQAQIIKSLNLKVSEQADLVSRLELTISQDAELIKKLNLNNQDQAKIIAALKLSNEQDKQLVAKLTADLAEQQRLLDLIKAEKQKTSTPTWAYYALAGMGIVTVIALVLKKKRR